ncbi:TPA: hypothetical protein DEP96_02925 [Candidatus Uhrbacteria bacterium]|nr:hypothetical protein [Candidatus Uhrbacteria bacterium]
MREAIYLALGFASTMFVALGVIPSLPFPLMYTPLVLITGLLVLQREGVGPGIAWLLLGSLLLSIDHVAPRMLIPSIIATLVAAIFANRVFATRSVYALMGLGLITGLTFSLVVLLGALFSVIFLATPLPTTLLLSLLAFFLLLQLGLYLGFLAVTSLRSWTLRTFVVR